MSKSIAQANALDENNRNNLWSDDIYKEMKDVSPVFMKYDNGEIVPIGYQRVNSHIIFDVKMEYLCCKVSLVAGGNVTDPPSNTTYESVVHRDTVRISLTLDSLNDLQVKVEDIQNSYTTAPVMEIY